MASRRVIYDSDDDEDGLSPMHSPPSLPVEEQHTEDTSSTDPSFFRNIYEEQQREPLENTPQNADPEGTHENPTAGFHNDLRSTSNPVRDLWEVPSSPAEAPPILRTPTKRKCDEECQEGLDAPWGQQQPAAKKIRRGSEGVDDGEDDSLDLVAVPLAGPDFDYDASPVAQETNSGLEICIPLKSMSSSEMEQFKILSSLPSANKATVEATATDKYPVVVEDVSTAPAQYVTQSTIAYTTPSIYASSGQEAEGGNSGVLAATLGIPPQSTIRQIRASSPALPLASPSNVLAASSSAQRHPHSEQKQSPNDELWGEHAARVSQRRQSQEEPEDELQEEPQQEHYKEPYGEEPPAVLGELSEPDEDWASSFGSSHKKQVAKKSKKTVMKKSQRRDSEAVANYAPREEESGSAYDSEPVIPQPKGKRGRKKKVTKKDEVKIEAVSEEALVAAPPTAGKAKRPRGRPKKTDAAKSRAKKAEEIADSIESNTEPDAVVEDENKPKALGETTGNTENLKDTPEEGSEAAYQADAESGSDKKSAQPLKEDETHRQRKDQTSASLTTNNTMVKSIMSINNSQGRVPYRVGLSRKHRIAPLLKSLKK